MRKIVFLSFLFSICFSINNIIFAQSPWAMKEHIFDKEAVKNAKNIIWYGCDLSNSKMRDYGKFEEGEVIVAKHIPAMIGEFGLRFNLKKFSYLLRNENITTDFKSIQDLFFNIDSKNFILLHNRELTIDSVKSIVKNYSLPQKDGVGVVMIAEMFNDVKDPIRYFSAYVTFFDITTRKVLITTNVKGVPGSKFGMTKYWVNGMSEVYDKYFSYYYKVVSK